MLAKAAVRTIKDVVEFSSEMLVTSLRSTNASDHPIRQSFLTHPAAPNRQVECSFPTIKLFQIMTATP